MGLFGKKPAELYAEAEHYVKLVDEWLDQPMKDLDKAALSDRILARYFALAVCSYLAQEKISPSARNYLAEAVIRTSTYCKEYVKDLKKELGFMAVLLNVMNTNERDARKSRRNVLEAIVKTSFKDFSSYKDPENVKRVVYYTVNQFVEEIETTDYKGMSLPLSVPKTAATAPSHSAPSYSAPSYSTPSYSTPSYSAPASSGASRAAAPKAPVSTPADDRDFYLTIGDTPYHFIQKGKNILCDGEVYKYVEDETNPKKIAMLHINGKLIDNVSDPALRDRLCDIFRRENPELAYLMPGGSSAPKASAAPASTTASASTQKADYTFRDAATGGPLYFNRQGRRMIYQNRVYELVLRRGGDFRILILDVTEREEKIIGDETILRPLIEIFLRENPELSYLLGTPKPERDLPDYFTIKNGETGKSERLDVKLWVEAAGFLFAYCPREDGTYKLIMRDNQGSFLSINDRALTTIALKTMKQKYPLFFE